MALAPSVLLLDDGELDRVQRHLERLHADFVRLKGGEIGPTAEMPRDLLITSGKRALDMPRMDCGGDEPRTPVWVCLHNQDFLPLRQRMRGLGVHYLVHSALSQESLRLFLLQLLYSGAERRSGLRLPLGTDVSYQLGTDHRKARLAELSVEMCRIVTAKEVPLGTWVEVLLPANLCGGEALSIGGRAIRGAACEPRPGQRSYSAVLKLEALDSAAEQQIAALVRGEQIGTRLTPLAAVPTREPEASEPDDEHGTTEAEPSEAIEDRDTERRRRPRHEYRRRVDAFAAIGHEAPGLFFGYDLSVTGVRIEGESGIAADSEVTLALYGGRREEPVVVDAVVVRDDGASGTALRFDSVSPEQHRQLEKLAVGLPALQSLCNDDRDDRCVIVSRVLPQD